MIIVNLSSVIEHYDRKARLNALEAKRAQKGKKIRVKEEEENIPPAADYRSRKKAKLNGTQVAWYVWLIKVHPV